MTETMQEFVKPYADRLTRVQWIAASIVIGFFFGFVDTLTFAFVTGIFTLHFPAVFGQLPEYVGVPTTFSGYFVSGYLLSRFAPREIVWEIPAGILICALLFMLGFVGFSGHGALRLLFHYVVLPGIAVGVCYVGLVVGREGWAGVRSHVLRQGKD